MITGVNNISSQQTFGIAKPKTKLAKQIVSDKKTSPDDALNNAIGVIGWLILMGAMIGSITYGIVDAIKNRKAEPVQTEQVEQPEVVKVDELTPVFDETI